MCCRLLTRAFVWRDNDVPFQFHGSAQADAACELWQTGCSNGTVFALRVSLVRKQQARSGQIGRAIRILPAIEKTGKREKWTRSSSEISASSRTSTTANPRSQTAFSK